MKKNFKLYIGLAVVAVIGLVVINNLGKTTEEASADVESLVIEESAIPVSAMTVDTGQLEDTIFSVGEIRPSASYKVNAKVNGQVDQVFFKIGDTVKKDDVLFTMKDETFKSDKSSKLQEEKNKMELSKIEYRQAAKKKSDTLVLFESGAVSSVENDKVLLGYKTAKAEYENAKASYEAAKLSFGDKSDFYTVKSPVDGLITGRTIEEGMFASPENGYTIIIDDAFKIESKVASKYISEVTVGQPVDVYINTLDKHLNGQVAAVSFAAEKGSYPIEVLIKDNHNNLYSGMYAELKIQIAKKSDVLLLPITTLMREDNKSYVFKIEGETVKKIHVTTGIRSAESVEVTSGLGTGDLVVVDGKDFLKDGSRITLKP